MKRTIALVLFVLLLAATLVGCGKKEETSDWEMLILGEYLPKPNAVVGEMIIDDEESLYVELCKVTKKDYREYVASCKEFGYIVDAENSEDSFSAFTAEGYKLWLSFWEEEGTLSVHLDAPVEMAEFSWPTVGVAKSVPVPKSNLGKVIHDSSDWFCAYIGDTPQQEFSAYVEACIKAGFDVDYSRDETFFCADNRDGISLTVGYEGFNTMRIDVDEPVEEKTAQQTEEKPTEPKETVPEVTEKPVETVPVTTEKPTEAVPETTEKPKVEDNGKIRKEFKEAMDAYEEFFDEYIEFMESYKKDPTNLANIGKYAKFMAQYAETMEEMEDWEDEEMNAAETIYYLEVTQRISKKLLEAAV